MTRLFVEQPLASPGSAKYSLLGGVLIFNTEEEKTEGWPKKKLIYKVILTCPASGGNSYLPVVLNGKVHILPPLVGQHEAGGWIDPAEKKRKRYSKFNLEFWEYTLNNEK